MKVRGQQQQRQNRGGSQDGAADDQLDDELDNDTDPDEEDADDDQGDEQDADDDENEDENEDAEDGDEFDPDEFMERVESRIDRRITGAMNKMMRRLDEALGNGGSRGGSGGDGQHRQRRGTDDRGGQQQQPTGPDATVARESRLVYREAIGDLVRFTSAEERAAANRLAQGIIASKIQAGGTDEDEIGEAAAKEVARTIKAIRKQAEDRVKANLRRQGILPDQKGGQGGTEGRGAGPGLKSELQKGAAVAERRHPQVKVGS